ncbi:Apoptosis-stimulating of p53 protein 2 [Schistosoma japonicum]|nr:Apoptosis-stimulating of p53 protein 2 [Schistosoma japonicum]
MPSSCINNSSSVVGNHQTVVANQKNASVSSHPLPPPLPLQQEKAAEVIIDDPGNEMTISELRSIAERQRQQLSRQAQQLQAREERRAWLRSLNSQRSAQNRCLENEKITSKLSDLSQEQEIRLHKLRGFRGQTEQVRLSNENLVKEIDRLASLLSSKEHDLQVCRQRADEAERMLTLISQWHNVISSARRQTINQAGITTQTVGTGTMHFSDETPLSSSSPSPLSLPFMQPPFFTELDKKRWHDGLVEADRLDRQFASVFGRKPPIQTWSSSQNNLHFVNSFVPDKKTISHISSSIPSVTIPAAPLPSYSIYQHAHSKSRIIDQSSNVHENHSPPSVTSPVSISPYIPGSHSNPIITQTPVTTIGSVITSNTAFSSVLTRDSSPPTSSRRSCFRTFMQLHPGYGVWNPNTAANNSNSNSINKDNILPPSTIHPLPIPRIKAPPRYASRAVINDTYMRRICRDSVEKYKRTASEIYLASVNKLNVKSTSPSFQLPRPMTSSSEWSNDSVTSEHQQRQSCTTMDGSIVRNNESADQISSSSVIYQTQHRVNKSDGLDVISSDNCDKTPDQKVHTTGLSPSSPSISASSSSSSLELIDIDMQPDEEQKLSLLSNELDSPEDEQKQQNSGDVDSGLGSSDHTVIKFEHQQPQVKKSTSILQMTTVRTPETTTVNTIGATINTKPNVTSPSTITTAIVQRSELSKKEVSSGIIVHVDDEHGVNARMNNNSSTFVEKQKHVKSILRKSKSPPTSKQNSSLDETSQSLSSSLCPSNSVRFHPLALLLDAALEGDLELVKKAASEVVDVSESNDEGITALHNAVCAGRVDVAEFLVLTAGADVNAGDTDGWTPLHCAASCGNVPLAKLLVEHGASLHARTLSDQETPLEKCDQGDEEAECEEYLYFQHERLGSAASGRVYALFPRGIESAGPGSIDAYLEPDELPLKPNELLTIIDREPPGEIEWINTDNNDRSYTQAVIEVEDVTSGKPPSSTEANHYIPRPSSVDFTELKIDDHQSSDEMGATNNNDNKLSTITNESCDLATAF